MQKLKAATATKDSRQSLRASSMLVNGRVAKLYPLMAQHNGAYLSRKPNNLRALVYGCGAISTKLVFVVCSPSHFILILLNGGATQHFNCFSHKVIIYGAGVGLEYTSSCGT